MLFGVEDKEILRLIPGSASNSMRLYSDNAASYFQISVGDTGGGTGFVQYPEYNGEAIYQFVNGAVRIDKILRLGYASIAGILDIQGGVYPPSYSNTFTANAIQAANIAYTLPAAQASGTKWLKNVDGVWSWDTPTLTFLALTDTPSSYSGQALKYARVNAGETALEFAAVSGAIGGSGTAGQTAYFSGTTTIASVPGKQIVVCTGTTGADDELIQAAINALPVAGGVVEIATGTCSLNATINLGDSPGSTPSTRNGITLLGSGTGATNQGNDFIGRYEGATILKWVGTDDGTGVVIKIKGAVDGCRIGNFVIDGNSKASTLIEADHAYHFKADNIIGYRWQGGYSVKIHTSPGWGTGEQEQTWTHINMLDPIGATANSLDIAPEASGNICQVRFNSCIFQRSANDTSVGLRLGYTDHITFTGSMFTKTSGSNGIAIKIEPKSTELGSPNNIVFLGTVLIGGVYNTGTWDNAAESALIFYPYYTADAQIIPPTGANSTTLPPSLVQGFTDKGRRLGYQRDKVQEVASGSTITVSSNVILLTGTTTVNTINLSYPSGTWTDFWGNDAFELTVIASTGGSLNTGTSGNIDEAVTLVNYKAYKFIYSGYATGKWHLVKH